MRLIKDGGPIVRHGVSSCELNSFSINQTTAGFQYSHCIFLKYSPRCILEFTVLSLCSHLYFLFSDVVSLYLQTWYQQQHKIIETLNEKY